ALARQALQQRRRLPQLAVLLLEGADVVVHRRRPHRVRIEHGAAPMNREAVAIDVDDVDVRGAEREALLEDPRPLVDEGVDAALEDFLVGDGAALDSPLLRGLGDERLDLGIGLRRAAALLVAIPARAGLLAEAPHLADAVREGRVAQPSVARGFLALADAPAHVESGHVA